MLFIELWQQHAVQLILIWACLIYRMDTHSVMNLGHLWAHAAFAPLVPGKKGSSIFQHLWMHVILASCMCPTCVCCMSKERENHSDLIPVSHGNPHSTCILSQRIWCNGHIYHNLYTKGHSAQDVEFIYTWINSACLKKRWKYKYWAICAHFSARYNTIFFVELLRVGIILPRQAK